MGRRIVGLISVGVLFLGPGAGPAHARDDEVRREGPCSGRSDWEIRVKLDDGAFRVRWRVDSGVPGQRWRMRLLHDGELIAASARITDADGEATLDLRGVSNHTRTDVFKGRARNRNSGQTCAGQATF